MHRPAAETMHDKSKLVHVHGRVWLGLCTVDQAKVYCQAHMKNSDFMQGWTGMGGTDDTRFQPSNLKEIHQFCSVMKKFCSVEEGRNVVLCIGSDPVCFNNHIMLLGAFFILVHRLSVEDVVKAFQPVLHRVSCYSDDLALDDCWRAIEHARHLGWLDFGASGQWARKESHDSCSIDIEEYIHYDNPLNGNLHTLVPNKFIVFPCPADLPVDVPYVDIDGVRHFGPSYFADLFGDFNVQLVVSASRSSYATKAFSDRQIEVEDLNFDEGREETGLLQKIDRFLTLTRYTPGTIAVHGGADGLGLASTLIAAYLMNAHHFGAKAAVAWICMVHPAAITPDHQQFLAENEGEVRRKRHSMPCIISELQDKLSLCDFTISRSISQPNIFDFIQ